MPAATRELRRRIRSVQNTKKITKAMELVASAKMRKVTQALLQTRPYTDMAWELLRNLSARTEPEAHPMLERREVKRQALVLMTTNRGLVGAFNTNLVNLAAKHAKDVQKQTGVKTDFILMGTKGRAVVQRFGLTAAADFEKEEVVTTVLSIRPLAKLAMNAFLEKTYDRVSVAYMDYQSTLTQKPRIRHLLPLDEDAFEIGHVEGEELSQTAVEHQATEYAFEPNPRAVLDTLLHRLVEVQLYRALLETNASEQAARMVAMRNASDSANELIDDLTLTYNQARQAAITQDLAEISAGRAALEA